MNLTIAETSIRQDEEGRFCLNDLHRAAGGLKRHQPSDWLRIQQTQDLIAELTHSGNSRNEEIQQLSPVVTLKGGNGKTGTFAVRELIYAYAMWVSPGFHLKVIRTYDEMVKVQMEHLKGLHFNAAKTELMFLEGVAHASRCGFGLAQWRKDKKSLNARIEELRREMQSELPLIH